MRNNSFLMRTNSSLLGNHSICINNTKFLMKKNSSRIRKICFLMSEGSFLRRNDPSLMGNLPSHLRNYLLHIGESNFS